MDTLSHPVLQASGERLAQLRVIPSQKAHRNSPTSEPLQPLFFPLLANDEEQCHPQRGQDDRAADGEQLLHIIPLPFCRLDGRDGA